MTSAPAVDDTIPGTASDTVEFVSATNYSGGSELEPASVNIDLPAYTTWVRTLESAGFDYTLNGYSSLSADSFIVATATGCGQDKGGSSYAGSGNGQPVGNGMPGPLWRRSALRSCL